MKATTNIKLNFETRKQIVSLAAQYRVNHGLDTGCFDRLPAVIKEIERVLANSTYPNDVVNSILDGAKHPSSPIMQHSIMTLRQCIRYLSVYEKRRADCFYDMSDYTLMVNACVALQYLEKTPVFCVMREAVIVDSFLKTCGSRTRISELRSIDARLADTIMHGVRNEKPGLDATTVGRKKIFKLLNEIGCKLGVLSSSDPKEMNDARIINKLSEIKGAISEQPGYVRSGRSTDAVSVSGVGLDALAKFLAESGPAIVNEPTPNIHMVNTQADYYDEAAYIPDFINRNMDRRARVKDDVRHSPSDVKLQPQTMARPRSATPETDFTGDKGAECAALKCVISKPTHELIVRAGYVIDGIIARRYLPGFANFINDELLNSVRQDELVSLLVHGGSKNPEHFDIIKNAVMNTRTIPIQR